jgi:hypothetical protein
MDTGGGSHRAATTEEFPEINAVISCFTAEFSQ